MLPNQARRGNFQQILMSLRVQSLDFQQERKYEILGGNFFIVVKMYLVSRESVSILLIDGILSKPESSHVSSGGRRKKLKGHGL